MFIRSIQCILVGVLLAFIGGISGVNDCMGQSDAREESPISSSKSAGSEDPSNAADPASVNGNTQSKGSTAANTPTTKEPAPPGASRQVTLQPRPERSSSRDGQTDDFHHTVVIIAALVIGWVVFGATAFLMWRKSVKGLKDQINRVRSGLEESVINEIAAARENQDRIYGHTAQQINQLQQAVQQLEMATRLEPEYIQELRSAVKSLTPVHVPTTAEIVNAIEPRLLPLENNGRDLQRIAKTVDTVLEQVKPPDPNRAGDSIKNYYNTLIDSVLRNSNRGSRDTKSDPDLDRVSDIRKFLKDLQKLCHPDSRGLIDSYLAESAECVPKVPDADDLKKEISDLLDDWDWKSGYRKEHLRWDMHRLKTNKPDDAKHFLGDPVDFLAQDRAALDILQRTIRKRVWKAVHASTGDSPHRNADDFLRSLRSRVTDLIEWADKRFPPDNPESKGAQALVKSILRRLDLTELTVNVGREEFDESRHSKADTDRNSGYEHNTIVRVVRRGLVESHSGAVHSKARVVVAARTP